MRICTLGSLVVAATAVALAPAYAQGRGGSHVARTMPATHANTHSTTSPKTSSSTTTATSTTTTATTSTTTKTTTTVSPIAQKISAHPQLASHVTALLPKGMTLNQAATGFRNQGQFIAALHVSKNLNIPFRELKRTMLGKTSTSDTPMSLGQAIHTLRPSADSTAETERATTQATADAKTTSTTTTTSSR